MAWSQKQPNLIAKWLRLLHALGTNAGGRCQTQKVLTCVVYRLKIVRVNEGDRYKYKHLCYNIMCTVHGVHGVLAFTIHRCTACPTGRYSVAKGTFHGNRGVSCNPCPYGADCMAGGANIRAQRGFWGSASNAGTIVMMLCPSGYCCSNVSCAHDACAEGRAGRASRVSVLASVLCNMYTRAVDAL